MKSHLCLCALPRSCDPVTIILGWFSKEETKGGIIVIPASIVIYFPSHRKNRGLFPFNLKSK